MEQNASISIHIQGKVGNQPLTPDNYDIREIRSMLDSVENLLFPNNKKDRPAISYDIQNGSVINIFKTTRQAVVQFSAVLSMVSASGNINDLDAPTAVAIENFQRQAIERELSFDISTSEGGGKLEITPSTAFFRSSDLWVDAEYYLYGYITDAGGKSKANVHLDTKEFGVLNIAVSKDFLGSQEKNLLYKQYGVRVKGKQNITTGELDKSQLELLELIDYNPVYDEDYINDLISNASPFFTGIDTDLWLHEIRRDS